MACEPRRSTLWGLRLPALLSGWVLPDPGARTVGGTGSERGERWLRLQRRRTARAAGRSLRTDRGRSCCGVEVEGRGSRNLTMAARQLYPSSRRSPTIWRRAHQAAVGNCRATGVAIDEFIMSTLSRRSWFPIRSLKAAAKHCDSAACSVPASAVHRCAQLPSNLRLPSDGGPPCSKLTHRFRCAP